MAALLSLLRIDSELGASEANQIGGDMKITRFALITGLTATLTLTARAQPGETAVPANSSAGNPGVNAASNGEHRGEERHRHRGRRERAANGERRRERERERNGVVENEVQRSNANGTDVKMEQRERDKNGVIEEQKREERPNGTETQKRSEERTKESASPAPSP